jgi:DNA-binding response OmpR family regulator
MTKVLIVEDSELLLRIMSDAFEMGGYQVVVAEDGEIALKLFIEQKPDLVVTDCLIPKMDGFKLVKNIREFEAPYRTPVMMTSAIYRKANYRQVALDAGADMYIIKPAKPEEHLDFVNKADQLLSGTTRQALPSEVPLT